MEEIKMQHNESLPDKIASIIAKIFNISLEFVYKIQNIIINMRDFILSLMDKMEYAAVT